MVHIIKEISILEHIFLHNTFPFVRYTEILKNYVHKCNILEGCIAKGYYRTKEVIEFCVDYDNKLKPIGVLLSCHEGRLAGKSSHGRKAIQTSDSFPFKEHYTIL